MDNELVTLSRAAKILGVCRMTFLTIRKKSKIKTLYRESDGSACVLKEDVLRAKKKRLKRKGSKNG